MGARLLFCIFLVLVNASTGAAEPAIDARVDRSVIGIDDQLRLEVVLSGGSGLRQSSPTVPAMDGFHVTSTGSSRNVQFVNGQMSSSVTFTYLLQPTLQGRLKIPAISAKIGDRLLETDPMIIEVKPGSVMPRQSQRRRSTVTDPFGWNSDPFANRRNRHRRQQVDPREHIEVKTSVDRPSAYLGQQVKLTFRMSISPLLRFQSQPQYTPPEVTGAWVETIESQRTSTERRDNGTWEVVEVIYALFPTTTTPVKIGPAKIEGLVDAGGMDLLSLMRASGHRLTLETDPIEVAVRNLPEEGRPAGFSGAVGSFKLDTRMDRDRGMVNDPFTLSIAIDGSGNPNTVPEPQMPSLESIRVFDPQSVVETRVENEVLAGSRVFERLLVPQEAGTWIFPELVLDFFDPETERYRQTRSAAIRVEVMPGESPTGGPVVAGISKEEVKRLKSDIEHIYSGQVALRPAGSGRSQRVGFWLLGTLPLVAVGSASAWRRREDRLRGDVAYARSSKAMKKLKKALPSVRSAGTDGLRVARRVFLDYMGDHLNLSSAGLTTEDVRRAMESAGYDPQAIEAVHRFLADLDMAQYAPSAQVANRAEDLAEDLETLARRVEEGPMEAER